MNLLHLPRALMGAGLLLSIGCGGASIEVTASQYDAEALTAAAVEAVRMLQDVTGIVDGIPESASVPIEETFPCDSGDVTLSVTDVEPEGLSTGDEAEVNINGCVVDLGNETLALDGRLYLHAVEISGDLETGIFTGQVFAFFDGITALIRGATIVFDGDLTASVSSQDGVTFVASVSGDSFRASARKGEQAFSGSLSDFRGEGTLDTSTDTYSVEFEATVTTEELGGSVHFETTVPFTGTIDAHPSAGAFVAKDAQGATVTVIVDEVNVEILIDADGDGVSGTTIRTTWEALRNAS